MAKDIKLGVVIDGSLSGRFSAAVGGAKQKLINLGAEIKSLGAQRVLIDRVEKDRAALEVSRRQLAATNREIGQLKKVLASGPPTSQAAKAMADARAKADRLSAAIEKQRGKLKASEQSLDKAGIKVGDLAGEYVKLGGALDATRAKQERLARTLDRKSAAAARLGDLRNKVIGLGAAAYGAGKIIGEAMDFESAMADVRKVVDFPEPDGLVKFGATIKDMSRHIPISAAGLAQIAAAGGQLGIAAKDLPDFTETVAKMATAFDMLPEEAGDAMAKLANVYQIPIGEMDRLGDAINHLSDNTAAKARDIVPVLARVGGTAKQFGLSAVQVAALGDAFIALGKPPEVAATAINAMLTKLQTATRQSGKFQEALAAIGMSAGEMEAAIAEDGQAALEKFLSTVAGIDKQARAGLLSDLFGMEYADDISLLTGSLDQYRKALGLVGRELDYAGSMSREFANRAATTANQVQLAKNSVGVLAINIGATLLPAINAVLRPVARFAGWMGDLAERFPWVSRLLGGAAVGLGVFVAGLGAAAAATWLFNAALLANPIGIVVAAIGGAAALIVTFWDPIRTFFSGLWSGIAAGASALWGGIHAGAAMVVAGVTAVWEPIKAFFGGLWDGVAAGASALWGGIRTAAAEPVAAIIGAWGGVGEFFSGLWQWLKNLFAEGVSYLAAVWKKSPLGLLFKAGQKIVTLGKSVAAKVAGGSERPPSSPAAIGDAMFADGVWPADVTAATNASPPEVIGGARTQDAGMVPGAEPQGPVMTPVMPAGATTVDARVNAPITIVAAPGQDERQIAIEVDRQLRQREAEAAARSRGALYD
ncbi:phage tail tape measure protein [Mycolicibacterium sp.]|uniref:phage tail tape measure protein n=1 Tax=Mycolicibacterium sp. TaxID=2320850 RepID=UPI00355E78CA